VAAAPTMPPVARNATDGRTARRDRNRDAVLDAVLDLFAEGRLLPTPAEVAERSGVSLRSVYRYVSDRDELVRAAIARNWQRYEPVFRLGEIAPGFRSARVEALVDARLRLHTMAAPTARAAIAAGASAPLVAARMAGLRDALRDQVDRAFAPELSQLARGERREVRAVLDLLLGFDGVEHLRHTAGLSAAAAARALRRSVMALLDEAVGPDEATGG